MSVTPSPWLKSAKEMWSRESSFYVFISRGGVCASYGSAFERRRLEARGRSSNLLWNGVAGARSKWRTQPDVLQRSRQEITTAHLQNLLHWRCGLDFFL